MPLANDPDLVLSGAAAREIISQCPALRVCHLTLRDREDSSVSVPGDNIEHTSLHTLYLHATWDSTVAFTMRQLFTRLSLPGLRKFKLTGSSPLPPENPMRYFTPFLAAAPHLESLHATCDLFLQTGWLDFLRGLNSLQRLTLDYPSSLDDGFLDHLQWTGADSCCPALRELAITSDCTFSDAAVLRFVRSRMLAGSGRGLERFEAYFGDGVVSSIDIRAAIQPLVDAGYAPPVLCLEYPQLGLAPSYSPWDGVESIPWNKEDA
ncbi:hypothetical protein FB45DRAFT_935867 [Roridomyces roridus]|uniref:Uncharacterized protein n=1 Tax=Roridomyces roridus TaxID=1738132 RepID=A0AAD7BBC0_9AGAR|nr:hypothetical protein FB45DRAFT_935867 [Roridomyces roridus]